MFHLATLVRTDRRLSVTDSQTVSNDSFKTFIVQSENGVKTAKTTAVTTVVSVDT